jgi:hypothetical protein
MHPFLEKSCAFCKFFGIFFASFDSSQKILAPPLEKTLIVWDFCLCGFFISGLFKAVQV